jgi:PAS domain S-box-containing protein
MSEGIKRGITLRATLVALICAIALYVAAIAAVIVFTIPPTASSLRRHSEALQSEFAAVRNRAITLRKALQESRELLNVESNRAENEKSVTARSLLDEVRAQFDDTRAIESARGLSGIPSEMRVALAQAADAESQLGVALIEVLSRMELGNHNQAAARLQYCDSLNGLTAARLAEAQAAGLADVIERQRVLGATADLSSKAVGWWTVLGLALVPFIALFVQRRFYRPLAAIDTGLARVAGGQLDTEIDVQRDDELGRLSMHFNEMTTVLRQRAKEERLHQEEELDKQRAYLDELFEGAPEAIVLLDTNDRVLRTNSEFTRMFGYTREDVLHQPFNDRIVPPEQREEGLSFLDKAVRGERVNVERVRQRKDGSRFDASVVVFPIRTSEGHIAFYSIYRDITDRKRAEAELQNRSRFERLISRISTDFINISARECDTAIDRALQVVADFMDADRGYVFQFSEDVAQLDHVHEYCAPGIPVVIDQLEAHQTRPRRWVFEKHRRGEKVIIPRVAGLPEEAAAEQESYIAHGIQSVICIPLKVSGTVLGFVGFDYIKRERSWSPELITQLELVGQSFANVLARKRAEESLRLSEEKFAKAFRSSPDSIALTALEDGRILDINDGHERMSGFTREEVIGRTTLELGYWVDREEREQLIKLMRLQGSVSNREITLRTRTGIITGLVSAEVINLGGKPVMLSIVRDISERKRFEQELERSLQQLHALSNYLQQVREEERTHIAREIHDELGQALTALKVDLTWVVEKLPPDESRLTERLGAMSSLTDSIIETVQKISTELRPGILDNLGLTAAIEWQTEEFASRTGIGCRLDSLEEIAGLDQACSTACFRILQETLTNVARHANATEVRISLKQQIDSLILEVCDNGKGISESSVTDRTSIGLLGMKERAHALGGDFTIDGVPGKGTRVMVSIPLHETEVRY